MRHKRIAAAEARTRAAAQRASRMREQAVSELAPAAQERAEERDVVPWLRGLGFNATEARRAAALCEDVPDASLEERVRVALSYFRLRGTVRAGG